ncbi:S1 family peptidase [Ferrovibrio terrae]|uniref:S1 family peptidase n=1 Tax=Ferrovibrio terrae TaxID=2594003 RepID=A0A516GZC8_9PROT|nr:trypsin-like serine protease [Ferrovibrio terrae]QDO96878.1 S1 family peptidase [Ferrovibrio terrae]
MKSGLFTICILSLLSLLPVCHAGAQEKKPSFTVLPAEPSAASPKIIGGEQAETANWPATFYFVANNQACTSTAIGRQVILTAAHCINDGAVGEINPNTPAAVSVTCSHHPRYNPQYENYHQYDVALCLASKPIPLPDGQRYERISLAAQTPRRDSDVILLGFGCRQDGGGGPMGVLYRSEKDAVKAVRIDGAYVVAKGRSSLCFGDSGGAAYTGTEIAARAIIGVNSRGWIKQFEESYLSHLGNPAIAWFVADWADKHAVRICGLNESGANVCHP